MLLLWALALLIGAVVVHADNETGTAGPDDAQGEAAASPHLVSGRTIPVALPDVALTFARSGPPEAPRLLIVTHYRDGMIGGIDLTSVLDADVRDPIEAFSNLGYERLAAIAADEAASRKITVAPGTTVMPVALRDRHIAAGTNYPEHAGEASVEGGPFLFAKLVRPTAPCATVSSPERLLDYEVELAFVTLKPLPLGSVPDWMGLILCNAQAA